MGILSRQQNQDALQSRAVRQWEDRLGALEASCARQHRLKDYFPAQTAQATHDLLEAHGLRPASRGADNLLFPLVRPSAEGPGPTAVMRALAIDSALTYQGHIEIGMRLTLGYLAGTRNDDDIAHNLRHLVDGRSRDPGRASATALPWKQLLRDYVPGGFLLDNLFALSLAYESLALEDDDTRRFQLERTCLQLCDAALASNKDRTDRAKALLALQQRLGRLPQAPVPARICLQLLARGDEPRQELARARDARQRKMLHNTLVNQKLQALEMLHEGLVEVDACTDNGAWEPGLERLLATQQIVRTNFASQAAVALLQASLTQALERLSVELLQQCVYADPTRAQAWVTRVLTLCARGELRVPGVLLMPALYPQPRPSAALTDGAASPSLPAQGPAAAPAPASADGARPPRTTSLRAEGKLPANVLPAGTPPPSTPPAPTTPSQERTIYRGNDVNFELDKLTATYADLLASPRPSPHDSDASLYSRFSSRPSSSAQRQLERAPAPAPLPATQPLRLVTSNPAGRAPNAPASPHSSKSKDSPDSPNSQAESAPSQDADRFADSGQASAIGTAMLAPAEAPRSDGTQTPEPARTRSPQPLSSMLYYRGPRPMTAAEKKADLVLRQYLATSRNVEASCAQLFERLHRHDFVSLAAPLRQLLAQAQAFDAAASRTGTRQFVGAAEALRETFIGRLRTPASFVALRGQVADAWQGYDVEALRPLHQLVRALCTAPGPAAWAFDALELTAFSCWQPRWQRLILAASLVHQLEGRPHARYELQGARRMLQTFLVLEGPMAALSYTRLDSMQTRAWQLGGEGTASVSEQLEQSFSKDEELRGRSLQVQVQGAHPLYFQVEEAAADTVRAWLNCSHAELLRIEAAGGDSVQNLQLLATAGGHVHLETQLQSLQDGQAGVAL